MADTLDDLITRHGPTILKWLSTSGLRVLLIMVVSVILIWVLFKLIRRIQRMTDDGNPDFQDIQEKRAATLSVVMRHSTRAVVSLVAGMMILREFGVDIGPIIAGAGIVGVAVGFGAQSLVKDVIAGFFILLENQFDVGDVVSGAGVSGNVERITFRFTQLRDTDGRVHFIPNGEFRVVSNLTRGWSRAVIDIAIGYEDDIDRVESVLTEVAEDLRKDPEFDDMILEPVEILGVDSLANSAVTIRLFFKTLPGKQWPVAREFRKRIKERFDALGIDIPVPRQVVHTVGLSSGAVATPTDPVGAKRVDPAMAALAARGAQAPIPKPVAGRPDTTRIPESDD